MSVSSIPLFVLPDEYFEEYQVRLESGDTLVVYSDGLVERDDEVVDLIEYKADLDEAASPEDLIRRLLGRMPAFLNDDVTIVALHRLAEAPELASVGGLQRSIK